VPRREGVERRRLTGEKAAVDKLAAVVPLCRCAVTSRAVALALAFMRRQPRLALVER